MIKKAKEFRDLSESDLKAKLKDLQMEKFKVRFEIDSTKSLKQAHRMLQIRKEIARIMTVLRELELAQLEQQLA